MQTQPSPEFEGRREGKAAQAIIGKRVHRGFCTATCPTCQLLGDELDGPRGRIDLMKQVLEGAPVTRKTQSHLDRCLSCRNCETTCPSGVQYGQLLDIGRRIVEERVERPLLLGCAQPGMMPNINSATARVLDAAGIRTLVADDAGCCGAPRTHLNDIEGGLADMRRNIDAWWPLVDGLTSEGSVEAIVLNASGCGVTVKDCGHALARDTAYVPA